MGAYDGLELLDLVHWIQNTLVVTEIWQGPLSLVLARGRGGGK